MTEHCTEGEQHEHILFGVGVGKLLIYLPQNDSPKGPLATSSATSDTRSFVYVFLGLNTVVLRISI